MKIHGKTLSEIYAEMILPQRIIVIAGCLFLAFTFVYLVSLPFVHRAKSAPKAGVVAMPNPQYYQGALDPALMVAPDGKNVVMAYTAARINNTSVKAPSTEIRLASARRPACNEWKPLPGGLAPRTEEIMGPDGVTPVKAGVWRAETPSLIYDAEDKGHEWKLFAYRYFWSGDIPLARLYSMIVYKDASAADMKWSEEKWLFSATDNAPPPPYNNLVQTRLNNLSPDLADVYFYARPSVIMAGTDILMTLSAYIKGQDLPDRIILVGSPDHGKTWRYLGTPLRRADLAAMQGGANNIKAGELTKLNGASLLVQKGQVYLAAVLGTDKLAGAGTFVLSFADLGKGRLVRDGKTAAPVIANHIKLMSTRPTAQGGGYAAYVDACEAGVITSEFSGVRQNYSLFKSARPLVEE